ncbi:MAG: galactokinase [Treponema sp.]|nr:galactokinase [Treponema sp.]
MIQKETLESIYGFSSGELERARTRYEALAQGFAPGRALLRAFSAPGRSELGGNHTDHNKGRVLAAAVHLDIAAVARARGDGVVLIRSEGFPDALVDISGEDGLLVRPAERGTTAALARGIAARMAARGARPGGFEASLSSLVPQGSGLSSSAAIETLIAKIFDSLHCGGHFSATDIAKIGQEAENDFFDKPCGLMDQAACACGGAVAIDFAGADPEIKKMPFDPLAAGFALCVVDTKASHADLTPDYAAIPEEMRSVARFFGKTFLREINLQDVLACAKDIRKQAGDRALLRAIHFFNEDERAGKMAEALQALALAQGEERRRAMSGFLDLANESGDSSWRLLQNMHPQDAHDRQGLAIAIALTKEFLRAGGLKGACRVHGGGFAGTIQAYVPQEALEAYREKMEALFGEGALYVLRVRDSGAAELSLGL